LNIYLYQNNYNYVFRRVLGKWIIMAKYDSNKKKEILDRMDRIPIWAFPASFIAIIGLGYFFAFFDIADIGFAMPAIAVQFHLTGSESLFVALAVGLIGYIIGSYTIGRLADKHGRLKTLLLTMVLIAIGSFGDALATGIITLSIWRFVTGMGVGADLNLVSTYIGELSPSGKRGRMSVMTFLIGIVGQAITPFVALALVPNFVIGWRLLFVIGGIIAAIAVVVMSQLVESPRWLVENGRYEEAESIVSRMEQFVKMKGIKLKKSATAVMKNVKQKVSLSKNEYRSRLALFVSIWFFWYIGNYGFLGDAATLLSTHSITIANSILFLAVGAIGYPVGALIMLLLADKFERKWLILSCTLIWFAGMALIGSLASSGIIMLGSFLASFSLGLFLQIAYTFTAESYPTKSRASGFALSDGIGHMGGVIGALALPILVMQFGFAFGFVAIGTTGLIAGFLALAGPTASGRSLEQISG
jgi:MFS transporter, putative metabolite:H+ symporter